VQRAARVDSSGGGQSAAGGGRSRAWTEGGARREEWQARRVAGAKSGRREEWQARGVQTDQIKSCGEGAFDRSEGVISEIGA